MNKSLLLILSIIIFAGCGSSSSGEKKIDIANYLPSMSMSKDFTYVTKIDGKNNSHTYVDRVVVESSLISIKEDDNLSRIITVKDDDIEIKYLNDINHSKIMTRKVLKGDVVSDYIKKDDVEVLKVGSQKVGEKRIRVEEKCAFESIINSYKKYFFEYINYDDNHDIMKIKCRTKTVIDTKVDAKYASEVSYTNGVVESKYDFSYIYLQKGLGVIALINDDCLSSKLPDVIDDTLEPKKCLGERFEYNLYQPQY